MTEFLLGVAVGAGAFVCLTWFVRHPGMFGGLLDAIRAKLGKKPDAPK